jgi:serine/threonine-protein kinase
MLLIHQVLYFDAPSPRRQNKNIPKDLDTICLKAMEKSPERRYQTAKEMGDDLRRFMDGKPILARRITWIERGWRRARRNPAIASLSAIAAALVILVGVLGWLVAGTPDEPKARKVRFTTNPPGARVVFVPIELETGNPVPESAVRPRDVTPLQTKLKPGRYLVVAVVEGHGFHEVYRMVPAPGEEQMKGRYKHQSWTIDKDGVTDLPAIENIPTTVEVTAGMVKLFGGEFDAGDSKLPDAPKHRRTVAPFWLAQTEVTVGEYRRVRNRLPDGLAANAGLTGDSDPVTHVNYFNALDFTEHLGLRLPTEWEYEFAATNGGTQTYPWGDDGSKLTAWPFGPVRSPDFDRTRTDPPIFGLYSGVAEWTDSRFDLSLIKNSMGLPQQILDSNRNSRVIRGGPYAVAAGRPEPTQWMMAGPRFRKETVPEDKGLPGLGFRGARSTEPRFQIAQSKDK